MTSNAPQGPRWRQASDGNWYPPQEQPGNAPPPPPGDPAPAGQTFANAPAASTVGNATLPVAAWLLYAGFAVQCIAGFLPARASSANGGSQSLNVAMTAALLLLVTVTFKQPQPRLWLLITLTVLIALGVLVQILILMFFGLEGIGTLLSTAGTISLAVGIIMAWIARSRAQP
jgi:hypothetical protein